LAKVAVIFQLQMAKEFKNKMKQTLVLAIACLPIFALGHGVAQSGVGDSSALAAQESTTQDLNDLNEPPKLGIHWARGFEPNFRALEDAKAGGAGKRSSPLMTYHGGKIMPYGDTQAIFWGPSWGTYTGDKITGMDTWFGGFGGSNYAKTSDEYTGSNGQVTATTTYMGHLIDTSAAANGASTSAILAEVCKVVAHPDTSGNGYYAVYVDVPRGNAGYCAYHSSGTCGGVHVQFAFFFKLDGDPGCDPADTSGLHSQGLAAIANVSGHELSEARSDPTSPGAWYDAQGNENGDKCAWTFNVPLVTFSNATQWKIQGEWSNAAYNAGTGYPNSSGQKGCLNGK
jgi:hypothetical protein